MDPSRNWSQIGPENPGSPTDYEDQLFHECFDWEAFCQSNQHLVQSSPPPSSGPSRGPDLTKLIADLPPHFIDHPLKDLETEFYRMRAPFRPDDEEISPSEYSSGQSPPELIRGGSTSPSDHSGSSFVDQPDSPRHGDFTLREAQEGDDEWTFPRPQNRLHSPKHSKSHHHQAHAEQLQSFSGQLNRPSKESTGHKRRRSGEDLDKRHRHLIDPTQTADVRRSGACLPCRVSKTKCHENGVCPTCRLAFPNHSDLVCRRITPAMAWPAIGKVPDIWSRHAAEEEILCSGPQFYTGNPKEISIFFTKDVRAPALQATVQAYRSQEAETAGGLKSANFPHYRVPSHETLQAWVEDQMEREYKPDFPRSLQMFLLAYTRDGARLPRHGLVSKVHKMNCFFRIWKTSAFWCRDPSDRIVSLPLSVQAQLRNIARKALNSIEYDILRELDDCLAQQAALQTEERIAMWASMWQLILIYREIIAPFQQHVTRVRDTQGPTAYYEKQSHCFMWFSDCFFPLIAIFYHYQFRTKKSLEVSLDWLKGPKYPKTAVQSEAIHSYAKHMLDSRKDMCKCFQHAKTETDERLRAFVVDHELKKLNARKRPSKA